MKEQYKHLKLIIETPTEEAMQEVSIFFGLKWIYNGLRHQSIKLDEGKYSRTPFGVQQFYSFPKMTYEQFKQQYMENTIDKEQILFLEGMVKLGEEAKLQLEKLNPPAEPKQMTVGDIISDTRPRNEITYSIISHKDMKRAYAYLQLLNCLHWANEGKEPAESYWTYEYEKGIYRCKDFTISDAALDFKFISDEAVEKFLAIKEVPELLNTFYGIGGNNK